MPNKLGFIKEEPSEEEEQLQPENLKTEDIEENLSVNEFVVARVPTNDNNLRHISFFDQLH